MTEAAFRRHQIENPPTQESMGQFMTQIECDLETKDQRIDAATTRKMAEIIEGRILEPHFLSGMSRAMTLMLGRRHRGQEETLLGPIMPTGINGTVLASMLLPRGRGEYTNVVRSDYPVPAHRVITGTPVYCLFRDPVLASKIHGKDHTTRASLWREALVQKSQRVKDGEELSMVNGGGWGHRPEAFLHRAELALHASRYDKKPYGLVWLPGYIGSMDSLHPNLLDNDARARNKRIAMSRYLF